MRKNTATGTTKLPNDRLLARLSLAFFDRPKTTFLIWLVLIVFGALSYTTFLKREGFPSINIPITIVTGTYFVDNPTAVDQDVAKPITNLALQQDGVSTIQTSSTGNFYSIVIQYKTSVNAKQAAKQLEAQVHDQLHLPTAATANFSSPNFGVTGGDPKKIDSLISLYGQKGQTTDNLLTPTQQAVDYLNTHKPALVKQFFLRSPYQTATNPLTGKSTTIQQTFDRFGDTSTASTASITIGVTGVDNVDVIKLDNELKPLLNKLAEQPSQRGIENAISVSSAPAIHDEISELQRVLLEGLIAVLVIGSIVIAVRASVITVLAMLTVILTSLGFLFLIGYTLNVITLFALILGLSLIVDDTIIMTEVIDAVRRRNKDRREVIQIAVRKISRAMVAATLTATLSFAPLLFASGILGTFIRAIPVTIIAALITSLLVALIFIPFFARFILLGKKQLGPKNGTTEVAARIEHRIALYIGKPMLWAKGSTKRLFGVGIAAIIVSAVFVALAGFIYTKVTLNIFPPTKDSNALSVSLTYKPGTSVAQAEQLARQADGLTVRTLGNNYVDSTYYGAGDNAMATAYVNLISYDKRRVTSPELVKQLQNAFDTSFPEASATIAQIDIGPPSSGFTVQIHTEDRSKAFKLADDLQTFMKNTTLTRADGSTATFKKVRVASPDTIVRSDGKVSVDVSADFSAEDTTTLVDLAQKAVKKEYTASKLASYGMSKNAIAFDIGQESDNQDSFKSLALALPVLLVAIYILLFAEFRSLLQPLLIFMAIPFSLFGVMLGLYLTDNALSFFAMLGFFALIGLSLKNTILLTDYANQSRKAGRGIVDSAVDALGERFRPLIATSLTAVVSLIPLAIASPFWQGLAVVLIFGLLSSTLLVILIFPYYYLAGEYLRIHVSRRSFFTWFIPTAILCFGVSKLSFTLVPIALVVSLVIGVVLRRQQKV